MNPVFKAALWMTGAITSFSAMAVAGREIAASLDTFELMLWRSLIGVAVVTGIGAATGRLGEISTRHMGTQLARNVSHFAGQNLWYFAVAVIPLAQVFALEFTSPLWALLLAPLVLGERLTGVRVLAAMLGFAGVLVIVQPGLARVSPGTLAAAGAAVGFAGSALFTRRLARSETTLCILFWLTAMQAVMALVLAGWDGAIALPHSLPALFWLLIIALGGLVAHYCLTTALRLAPATVVIPIDFARLPLIALVGALIYDERLALSLFVGAGLIIAGNFINLRAASRARPD